MKSMERARLSRRIFASLFKPNVAVNVAKVEREADGGERELFVRLVQNFVSPFAARAAPVNLDQPRVLRDQDVFLQTLDALVGVKLLVAVKPLGPRGGGFYGEAPPRAEGRGAGRR